MNEILKFKFLGLGIFTLIIVSISIFIVARLIYIYIKEKKRIRMKKEILKEAESVRFISDNIIYYFLGVSEGFSINKIEIEDKENIGRIIFLDNIEKKKIIVEFSFEDYFYDDFFDMIYGYLSYEIEEENSDDGILKENEQTRFNRTSFSTKENKRNRNNKKKKINS